ncbi:hypothetical protein BS47DRAFT_1340370 [Hydnum rufescens UP504]|uniref:Uncharacterized protein n=1 Tax=Hydnum rufescens UP504 TaxID=1448309 RepID=A0A9P6B314_9AGAM|nr:hypothetical protein BS47DRAFT_1340370 [Hydnum rufescens UP504]
MLADVISRFKPCESFRNGKRDAARKRERDSITLGPPSCYSIEPELSSGFYRAFDFNPGSGTSIVARH